MSLVYPVSPDLEYPGWLARGDVRFHMLVDDEGVRLIIQINGETFGKMFSPSEIATHGLRSEVVIRSEDGRDPKNLSADEYRRAVGDMV